MVCALSKITRNISLPFLNSWQTFPNQSLVCVDTYLELRRYMLCLCLVEERLTHYFFPDPACPQVRAYLQGVCLGLTIILFKRQICSKGVNGWHHAPTKSLFNVFVFDGVSDLLFFLMLTL